ncbi:MAG: adenylate/guanylate cyclase domain-containing protein, partial [Pseudomonadota bacterium]
MKARLPALLPASLRNDLGESASAPKLPARVQRLVAAQERDSERLISWAQVGVVLVFGTLYTLVPKPADAGMLQPVPLILGPYFVFSMIRLAAAYRGFLPGWFLVLSMLVDVAMLWGLIWSFHLDYDQPAVFYLKIPTFTYMFVLIAIRALRFDPRFVLSMGAFAAVGWTALVAYAVLIEDGGAVTRNFVDYLTGNYVLLGAEFDKVFVLLAVTLVLSLAVHRARQTLIIAVREEAAGRDIRRFLPAGVAEAVAGSEDVVQAGRAEAREAAVVFVDIRGFTRFSQSHSPEEVVAMLTSFHARAVPLIRDNGGIVDKFMGDGIMATFGAVEASSTAAADALRAIDDLMAAAAAWKASIDVPLEVNAAMASGRIVFAAIGHEHRLEYT